MKDLALSLSDEPSLRRSALVERGSTPLASSARCSGTGPRATPPGEIVPATLFYTRRQVRETVRSSLIPASSGKSADEPGLAVESFLLFGISGSARRPSWNAERPFLVNELNTLLASLAISCTESSGASGLPLTLCWTIYPPRPRAAESVPALPHAPEARLRVRSSVPLRWSLPARRPHAVPDPPMPTVSRQATASASCAAEVVDNVLRRRLFPCRGSVARVVAPGLCLVRCLLRDEVLRKWRPSYRTCSPGHKNFLVPRRPAVAIRPPARRHLSSECVGGAGSHPLGSAYSRKPALILALRTFRRARGRTREVRLTNRALHFGRSFTVRLRGLDLAASVSVYNEDLLLPVRLTSPMRIGRMKSDSSRPDRRSAEKPGAPALQFTFSR